ncbi:MAG: hypothetical protein QXV32_02615 [Conexivisphaerales archaeon]
MPEIWLPYGKDEVVINVKAENINHIVESSEKQIDEEELLSRLENVEYSDLVIHDGSRQSRQLIELLQKKWESSSKKPRLIEARSLIFDSAQEASEAEHLLVDGSMLKVPSFLLKGRPLVISSFSFNPIFGFFGPHLLLAAASGLVGEAMKRWDRKLSPGGDPDAGWFLMRFARSIPESKTVTFVRNSKGITEVRYGDIEATIAYMKDYLKTRGSAELQQSRLVVLGAGGDVNDSTFASSLLSVANNLNAIADDAEIIIVAECIEGLGSSYIRRIVDGAQLSRDASAWEEVILNELAKRGRIHLVSTLPKSIVERRLKMKPYSALRDAFESVQQAHGWRFKANIIADSSNFITLQPTQIKE